MLSRWYSIGGSKVINTYLRLASKMSVNNSAEDLGKNEGAVGGEKLEDLYLLLDVEQVTGKPLPIGSWTERKIMEECQRISGVMPVAVTILNDHEALLEYGEGIVISRLSM